MSKNFTSLLLVIILGFGPAALAQEQLPTDNFDSLPLGDLAMQANWTVTKLDPASSDLMEVSIADPTTNDKFIEITNYSSISAIRPQQPQTTGVFEFKARHNQVGLFYIYAQTSDNGGQLLFSLQFSEDNGILLEQASEQVTLLSDYTKDQWYHFLINFDNNQGDNGSFTVEIDGVPYGQYEYVDSESETFDFAQITIGSETTGDKAVSAFADITSTSPLPTATTSSELLSLSISLSSTSISSNLENGLIVTASLDGIASVATSSVFATEASTTDDISTTTEEAAEDDSSSGVVDFVTDIIEDIIDIFIPNEEAIEETPTDLPTETLPDSTTPAEPIEEDVSTTTEELPPTTEDIVPIEEDTSDPSIEETPPEPEPVAEDETVPDDATASHENITTEF